MKKTYIQPQQAMITFASRQPLLGLSGGVTPPSVGAPELDLESPELPAMPSMPSIPGFNSDLP